MTTHARQERRRSRFRWLPRWRARDLQYITPPSRQSYLLDMCTVLTVQASGKGRVRTTSHHLVQGRWERRDIVPAVPASSSSSPHLCRVLIFVGAPPCRMLAAHSLSPQSFPVTTYRLHDMPCHAACKIPMSALTDHQHANNKPCKSAPPWTADVSTI